MSGLPSGELHQLMVIALKSQGRVPRGCGVPLRSGCFPPRFDPAAIHTGSVCLLWAGAVWEGYPAIGLVDDCLAAAWTRMEACRWQWQAVSDPVEAFLLTAGRIGWTVIDARRLSTDQGFVFISNAAQPQGGGKVGKTRSSQMVGSAGTGGFQIVGLGGPDLLGEHC